MLFFLDLNVYVTTNKHLIHELKQQWKYIDKTWLIQRLAPKSLS